MNLTARQLKEGLHKGFDFAQFAERYQCTEEEIRNSINAVYRHNENDRNKILREFEKNSKKKAKTTIKHSEFEEHDNTKNASKQVEVEKPEVQTSLTQLLEQEKNLSNEVKDLELSRKDLYSERKAKNAELVKIHEKLVDLKNQFKQTLDGFNTKNEEIESLTSEISKQNSLIQERKIELDNVRINIKELSAITVFVYDNGELEISKNAPEITIVEDNSLMSQLMENALCQELRLKDIRVLSNTIVMNRAYRDLKFDIQFVFDNELMEQIFCLF